MNPNKPARKLEDLLKEHGVDEQKESDLVLEIELNKVYPNPNQPRKLFDQDKIEALAISIKQNGLLQPIVVKAYGDGYMIIAGERRYRAYQQLNEKTIPAIIRQFEERKVLEVALIENIQRENLNPIEEAKAYQYMVEKSQYKHHEIALKVGKSRTHIANMIGLLTLPEKVKTLVELGKLSMGHARALSKLSSEKKIITLAEKIISEDLSVRDIEKLTQSQKKKAPLNQEKPFLNETLLLTKKFKTEVKVSAKSITFKTDVHTIQWLIESLLK
jgi:ParB family transcriptional regulator, chromosome partitioning protein